MTRDFVQIIFEYAYMHESIDSYVMDENGVFLCTIQTPKCNMIFDEWLDQHNIEFEGEVEMYEDEHGSRVYTYTMELKEYIKYFKRDRYETADY